MDDITVRTITDELPPAEVENFYEEALEATSFTGFPGADASVTKSQRLVLFNCVAIKYANRLRSYRATGKFPEQIAIEKERADRREGWLWLVIILLAAALLSGWMDRNGIHGCDDPDVVLGGCNSE